MCPVPTRFAPMVVPRSSNSERRSRARSRCVSIRSLVHLAVQHGFEEVGLLAQLLGEFRLQILLGGGVVGVNLLAVLLPFDHDGVGRGGEGETDRPGHGADVHPHLASGVEFGVDAVVGLLERGVVVVHVLDDDALGFRAEEVLEVLAQLSGEVAGVLDVGLAPHRTLQEDDAVHVELVAHEGRDEPVVVEADRDDVRLHGRKFSRNGFKAVVNGFGDCVRDFSKSLPAHDDGIRFWCDCND